jgi:tetratricopeptide (TPR) repeat protein
LPLYQAERVRLGEANLLKSLGDLESRLGNIDEARAHYDAALPLYQAERDRLGEANVYLALGILFTIQQHKEQARTHLEQALMLYRAERDPLGQANALQSLGVILFESGEHEEGINDIQQATILFRSIQDEQSARRAELLLAEMQARMKQPEVEREVFDAFVGVKSPQQMLELVQQRPQLLTDAWFTVIEGLIDAQTNNDARQHLRERLDTLKQIRQDIEQQTVIFSKMADEVIAFARANWEERRRMLDTQGTPLLRENIEQVFPLLLAANEDEGVRQVLEDVRTLLRRCRTLGVVPVFYFARYMHLGDSIKIPEEDEQAVMQIAMLLARRGEDEEALEQAIQEMEILLNRSTTVDSLLFEGALKRDLAEVIYALPAGHAMRRLDRVENCYREALPLYRAADRPLSVAYIQRALGDMLLDLGRYDEALKPLHEAAQGLQVQARRNDAAWALSAYAGALDNLGRVEEAMSAYAQAKELLPDMPALLRNHAEVLIHAGKLAEAEAELARAVELDGNEDSAYLWQRRAQLALAQGDGALAEQMLDEALKRDANMDVAFLRAQSAWLRGDSRVAREHLHRAFQAANAGEQAAMRREWQRLAAGRPDALGLLAELP